ncbi:uncharacterized protein CELE_F14F7.4 [Caenorhabditis elegans]|uniref:Transmembrane protein n=1 Tax=Caenorhabditis elegans TaxID=6239 RepID=O17804_CAEEL|nr:Transmembrane protein [Caenorhabditis elegans]CAB04110.2 Transmembrane protein [Caenorhabditis elegans]|eukprot:NP_499706.1 Uncharacterized protein CELE_F14F7.4 [Caenorhabditis elegans]
MDVQFKARSLWNTGKEVTVKCTKALSNGIRFSEFYSIYTSYIRVIIPISIQYPVDCITAYLLFHLYLAYILVFAVSLEVLKKFKTKGSGIAPITGSLKEKAAVYMTYFFVFQSISKWTFGIATLDKVMGWAFQLKPQINLKPQIKIGKSKSSESVISVKNKVGTAMHVGFESEDEDTRKTIKNLGKMKRRVDFVTEVADAFMMGQEATGDEEDESNWQDARTLDLLVEPDESTCQVQKWLEDGGSMDSDDVKKHVMKLMAENQEMRRQSFAVKPVAEKNTEN